MEQNRRGLLLLCCVGLAVGAAVWVAVEWTPRSSPANATLVHATMGEEPVSNGQYEQLDSRLARLETLIGAGQGPVPLGTAGATSGHAAAVAPEVQQARDTELQARYQHLFETDARAADAPKWEAMVERSFSDPDVADSAEQPSTRSARCRARLCLITATFPPDMDSSDWTTRLSMALADGFTNSRVASATLPSGETSLAIYAFKKGGDKVLLDQGL